MKARFTNIDIVAAVCELQELVGLRVTNVYDVDHKVYLFKFAKPDSKVVLLMESGIRVHTTEFEWPKNHSPSGFAMKLRKHIRNRRLEGIRQLGVDRIVDLQFGSREAAYHVILELYDRGNIILTDHAHTILNVLRPRTDQDTDVRYVVHEIYPLEVAKQWTSPPAEKDLNEMFQSVPNKEQLKKILNMRLFYGSALVEHALLSVGLVPNLKIAKDTDISGMIPKLMEALRIAESFYKNAAEKTSVGIITCKTEKRLEGGSEVECQVYQEFHPFKFLQLMDVPLIESPSFMRSVDEFYSKLESQKLDSNIVEQQKHALKKLENVQKDHEKRLGALRKTQEKEELQARLIEENVEIVDRIIVYMRTIMAAELSWMDVAEMLERRRERGDEVAERVIKADIAANTVTVALENPHNASDSERDENEGDVIKVDINLNESAFQNVTRLHSIKKRAARKEHKTVEASHLALKNAEKKTRQVLKDVATMGSITKARKTQWFEKFYWFISTEDYVVIGGRDAQQNEILVKRYMKANDFYVHADLHGASSVVVKNPSGGPPPPKTLNEAGVMAISYSSAWEAKIPCKAWWVYSHQVTKTAPTGEYLSTGSFMIRGRKNFFPDIPMVMGFGVLFKIDEDSVRNHEKEAVVGAGERIDSADGAAELEEVVLEMNGASGDEEPREEKDSDSEAGDGVNLLRALASKLLSTGGDTEESTLITATVSGFVPKTPQQKATSAKLLEKQGGNKKLADKNDAKGAKVVAAIETPRKKVNDDEDDNDWSDYKKKGKGQARPAKNYNQRHQGQPVKPKKSKKGRKESVVDANLTDDALLQAVDSCLEDPTEEEEGESIDQSSNQEHLHDPMQVTLEISGDTRIQQANAGPTVALEEAEIEEPDEEDPASALSEDVQMLKTFVGDPLPDDVFLFCIPVCAPYVAMQNYKYKVKLLPGTAKRGKAAKSCFQTFLHEKSLTPREKDILKSVKDQDFSRNFPGSVKVAVTQQKFKQRRK